MLEVISSFWGETSFQKMLPPPICNKVKGRPKKMRRKEGWENPKNPTRITRKGRKMHCSKCRQTGHNKSNYPAISGQTDELQSSNASRRQFKRKSCTASVFQKNNCNNDMVQSDNSSKLQVKRIKTHAKVPGGYGVYVSPEGAVIDNMNGHNSGLVFMPTPGEVIYQDGSSRNNTPPATRMYRTQLTSSNNPPISSTMETLNQSSQLENMID